MWLLTKNSSFRSHMPNYKRTLITPRHFKTRRWFVPHESLTGHPTVERNDTHTLSPRAPRRHCVAQRFKSRDPAWGNQAPMFNLYQAFHPWLFNTYIRSCINTRIMYQHSDHVSTLTSRINFRIMYQQHTYSRYRYHTQTSWWARVFRIRDTHDELRNI
jgi:hypothetical protein